jgi:hypothetical protein
MVGYVRGLKVSNLLDESGLMHQAFVGASATFLWASVSAPTPAHRVGARVHARFD